MADLTREPVLHVGSSQRGRALLLWVTVLALMIQAIKLGSRGVVLGRWPTPGQWGQLVLVVWLLFMLWEGTEWARVTCAIYFSLATVAGIAATYVMWERVGTSLRLVGVFVTVAAAGVSLVLWFSRALRGHLAKRLAAGRQAG